mmetsp:Transcript_5644/g.13937  ORF Transcript_5644/g.13937 Transcript_5644/m.13937 type:complete len:201 (-) Transcript_5644:876-1478(-)
MATTTRCKNRVVGRETKSSGVEPPTAMCSNTRRCMSIDLVDSTSPSAFSGSHSFNDLPQTVLALKLIGLISSPTPASVPPRNSAMTNCTRESMALCSLADSSPITVFISDLNSFATLSKVGPTTRLPKSFARALTSDSTLLRSSFSQCNSRARRAIPVRAASSAASSFVTASLCDSSKFCSFCANAGPSCGASTLIAIVL